MYLTEELTTNIKYMENKITEEKLKVGQTYKLVKNGHPYRIDQLTDAHVCVSNIYNGRTDIVSKTKFVEKVNRVNQ